MNPPTFLPLFFYYDNALYLGFDATYLLWLDCSKLNVSSKVLSEFLRTNQGLFLSPGIDFGENGDNFLRMNIACPKSVLDDALARLKAGIIALNIIDKNFSKL